MGLIVDSFAGGGGASTGIEAALGRSIDIAINHDPEALALHKANHPGTKHIIEDIWGVDPAEVCAGEPVDVMWCSPDCTHFSKAKGGKPRDKRIRGLAWIAVRWARRVRPKVIFLENVEEFRTWGPVDRKGHPVKRLAGRTFWRFVHALQKLGYTVEWKELRACDYGAPTTRLRFYLIARCDGLSIIWPTPTHATASNPVRTAAECIDWSIPCPSIFERKKTLADATCRRIAKGIVRYVLNNPKPFIVGCGGRMGQNPARSIDRPVQTLTAKADSCLVVPYFSQVTAFLSQYHGEMSPNDVRGSRIDAPLMTVDTSPRYALVSAFLAKHYGGVTGSDCRAPIGTVTAVDHHSLVAAHLMRQFGTSTGSDLRSPMGTVMPEGCGKTGIVATFLSKYYGCGVGQGVDVPMDTVTAKDRFGLVTVLIDGETYILTDIGMRMLKPRELFRAQGFPDSYVIDPVFNGRRLPGTSQVRMCGNSVCPPVAEALVRANAAELYGEAAV